MRGYDGLALALLKISVASKPFHLAIRLYDKHIAIFVLYFSRLTTTG